ncbi:MAG: NUDIX domain-containing protein [Candidatus Lokiarchaeota archaeon]|nr:NUDIX domain-containing protein [Candidatus Lokiarchaeota archaeon]
MSSYYPVHPIVGVGTVILKKDEVLIIQRAADPDKGLWSVPGGKVDYGEPCEIAAAREVEEETQLKVDINDLKLVDIVNKIIYDKKGKIKFHFVIVDYVTHKFKGEVTPSDDALQAKWVKFQDLNKYEYPQTIKELFHKLGIWIWSI